MKRKYQKIYPPQFQSNQTVISLFPVAKVNTPKHVIQYVKSIIKTINLIKIKE